jgi:hypothetical protein
MVEYYPQVIPKYSEKNLTCPSAISSANNPLPSAVCWQITEGIHDIKAVHFK